MMNSATLKERENNKKFKGAGGRKKRTKNNVCNDSRSWADLSVDLLDIISNNLNLTEILTFGKVCRNWRLFSLTFPQQRALVFYISTKAKNTSNPVPSYAKPRIAALKLPNAASKSPKDRNALWRSYFTTFEPRGDFLVVLLSNNYKDVRFCSSKDNNWKVYTFAYQSWDIVDIVVYNGRVFVVTDDCRIGVLNLGSSNDSEMGVLILESSNIKFLKLKGTPHLGGKIRFVASNEQLLVVNFKDKPILMHLETRVYSIEFSTREWVKVNNFGGKALFLNNFTCLLSTNTTRWGEHSNYIYYLSSKNSHMCLVYSDSGEFVRHITCCTRTEHRDVPLICCWHFPNQFYSIKNVKDYDDDQFERYIIED
ncbi:hypothetical protein QYF36_017653 [Acer negundo]|nr:hypothetical protein QYF36_017653 [Acer negundo]